MPRGWVLHFEHGVGKIVCADSTERFFVHWSAILGEGFRTLVRGEPVEFSVEHTPKGPAASAVRRISPRTAPPAHFTRVDADEAGTHGGDWLIIGMLFTPEYKRLQDRLMRLKDDEKYHNTSTKYDAKLRELHFKELHSGRDARLAKNWIDAFLHSGSEFRAIVVSWPIFFGKYFGHPFETDALKKRRAYKKWAEQLLRPELRKLKHAQFYLDRLKALKGYDVLMHLKDTFSRDRDGELRPSPRIKEFYAVDSWRDAHQPLQLCDLLVGCIHQKLVPSTNSVKLEVTDHLYERLKNYGVKERGQSFWSSYTQSVLSDHFMKFSEWYWEPKE